MLSMSSPSLAGASPAAARSNEQKPREKCHDLLPHVPFMRQTRIAAVAFDVGQGGVYGGEEGRGVLTEADAERLGSSGICATMRRPGVWCTSHRATG